MAEERDGRGTVWPLLAALLIAAAVMIAWLYNDRTLWTYLSLVGDPEESGQLIGSAVVLPMGATVAIWFGLYLLFLRNIYPPRGGLYLVIMVVANLAVGLITGLVIQDKAHEVPSPFHLALREMARAVVAADGAAPVDTTPKTAGDAGTMEKSFKEMTLKVQGMAKIYHAAIADAGYPASMTPARLAATSDLGALRAKLKHAREAAEGYVSFFGWLGRQGQGPVLALPLPESVRLSLDDEFASTVGREIARRDAVVEIDVPLYRNLEAMAALLVNTKGRWSVSGNRIRFADREDQFAYDSRVSSVEALTRTREMLSETISP